MHCREGHIDEMHNVDVMASVWVEGVIKRYGKIRIVLN